MERPPRRVAQLSDGTGAQVLDAGLRIVAPETGADVTDFHVQGARYTLEIARIVGARRAYLKGGTPPATGKGSPARFSAGAASRWFASAEPITPQFAAGGVMKDE